ncbi:DUF4241 domain-containing protein [Actinoplanes sp. NPDC051346]|uniref:DUF4241 domain-containing protein n=1 Tax=Actinoplanes sp. NPDC051346 TaxID=3155048 RepID=UPI00341347A9
MAVDIGEMLDRLLTEGAQHRDDTHDYRLTSIPLGEVTLPTGRVVACDPLVLPGAAPPFTVTVAPGRYRLRAWVAVVHPAADRPSASHRSSVHHRPGRGRPSVHHRPGSDRPSVRHRPESDRRTAALQLVLRDEPVTAWEPALLPYADPLRLDEDHFFAYPVDSGLGTLADERALAALTTWSYARVEQAFLPEPSPPAPGALHAITHPPTGANVVAVCTGWGDGDYATFIGRTARGDVASFVTDFRVI